MMNYIPIILVVVRKGIPRSFTAENQIYRNADLVQLYSPRSSYCQLCVLQLN